MIGVSDGTVGAIPKITGIVANNKSGTERPPSVIDVNKKTAVNKTGLDEIIEYISDLVASTRGYLQPVNVAAPCRKNNICFRR